MNNKPNSSLKDLIIDEFANKEWLKQQGRDAWWEFSHDEPINATPHQITTLVEQYIKSLVPEKKVDEQNIIGTIYGYDVRGEAIKGSYWAGYNAAIDKFNRRLDSSRREL